VIAVVGLGSNLGDRRAMLDRAMRELARIARVEAASHVYETAPVGPPQGRFFNAAALIAFAGTPEELLDALLAIERRLGRVRGERWGPRTIDLDVLWIDGVAVASERLTVPHPRLHERAFALAPLLEVRPDARDPATGDGYVVPPGDVVRTGDVLAHRAPRPARQGDRGERTGRGGGEEGEGG
jgi:2-amino-4-hydroxy-6-hydroxymethyldihydropteridine diphosphokinase